MSPAQSDSFLGQGNDNNNVPDTRVALLGGAFWGYPFAAGGPIVVATSVGQGFAFTLAAPEAYDRVSIDYLDSGGGTLNISVDGGPVLATLQVGNTGLMTSQVVTLPAGTHAKLTVTAGTSATTDIEGAAFFNSQTPAVQIFNAGEGGAPSSVVGDGVTPGAGEVSGAAALGANLAMIDFGINDILQGTLTAAQTTANIALMVTEFRANGTDPIIIIPQPIASANYTAEIATLRADIENLATSMDVPLIDLSATYGDDPSGLAAAGLLGGDGVHPTAALYASIASGIASLLTAASTPAPTTTTPTTTPPASTSTTTPATTTAPTTPTTTTPSTPSTSATTTTTLTPAPVAAPVTVGSGPNSIVLDISEDAYLGDAQFTLSVDGTQYGATQTATASHSAGAEQSFTIEGSFAAGLHIILVNFLNDAYAGTPQTDRNLYVDQIAYGGVVQNTAAALDAQGPQSFIVGSAVTLSTTTTATMTATPVTVAPATAQAIALGSGPDTLALQVSEDAYLGDAQFTVSVGGTQIGGVQTASASHAGGAAQVFDVEGSFAGLQVATVTFLNDAYGGTPQTDRKLYVTGATIDGATVSGATLAELSQGSASFTFQAPATSRVVSLNVAEDAYLGDAQFTVSVDGAAATAPQTVTASHAAGTSQQFSLGALSVGSHEVAVSFINDLYAGTPSTDRNLYVTGINVGGASVFNGTVAITGDWTSHLTVNVT